MCIRARLYGALLDGSVPDLEQGAIAIALRMKTETVDEMAGFLAAANERLPRLGRPSGAVRPIVIPSYNGVRRSANLSPRLARLLRRFGVPVLGHGLSLIHIYRCIRDSAATATASRFVTNRPACLSCYSLSNSGSGACRKN